ncbi:CocE/NonD family hydrolase [Gordonia sp. NB41Y]|uniref:alpha/beta hydrolase family protein n=1 Tax=Gordonia sp. NB41Y TaxID=875808 RepID=UPI000346AE3E|nr:CocE/NonD family hydrolase [Gordonia sp. NB41Y]EMP12078.2 dipeptidyl aminopeptidase [Gordonia sp. NB41Y]WLP91921.1 CocE/NonD family hydrolase [Gordonia sp. NB41Y]
MNDRLAFADEEFDGQFMRTLQAAAVGAADLGEAFTTARAIGNRYRPERWHRRWLDRAESLRDIAERAHVAGHLVSAQQAYLRASEYYRQAYFFLRSDLDDQRLRDAYQAHAHTFAQAMELLGHTGSPVVAEAVTIPYEADNGVRVGVHAWMFRPGPETEGRRRPTIVMPCGYDSTAESGWGFAQGALARGYTVLSVEGPGQGASLVVDRLYFRPDYEVVLSQILDWLVEVPDVDTARIAVVGRSFAGYLAPRGVAGEPRVAALVCDPAQPDMGAKIPVGWRGRVAAPLMTALTRISRERAEFFGSRMACHGLTAIADYFAELRKFTLTDRIHEIACPTMIVESFGDPVGGHGRMLFDALTAPGSVYVDPDPATGISGHCGGLGQMAWDATVYDWLDETLAAGVRPAATTRDAHR